MTRYRYRDAKTGRFISKAEYENRDEATTIKERVDASA